MGKLIGRRIGAAEATGGAAGNFTVDDHYWLSKRHQMIGDPGIGGPTAPASETPLGHTATGGIISDWADPGPGNVYRTHIFTGSGTFTITALSPAYPAHVDYLVVAGGGGGGYRCKAG